MSSFVFVVVASAMIVIVNGVDLNGAITDADATAMKAFITKRMTPARVNTLVDELTEFGITLQRYHVNVFAREFKRDVPELDALLRKNFPDVFKLYNDRLEDMMPIVFNLLKENKQALKEVIVSQLQQGAPMTNDEFTSRLEAKLSPQPKVAKRIVLPFLIGSGLYDSITAKMIPSAETIELTNAVKAASPKLAQMALRALESMRTSIPELVVIFDETMIEFPAVRKSLETNMGVKLDVHEPKANSATQLTSMATVFSVIAIAFMIIA